MNLKYKVLISIAILLLLASVSSSIINYRFDVDRTQEQLTKVSLPLSVDNIYTEIQQRMIEPLIISSLMSNDTFVKDWTLQGEKSVASIEKYLLEIQNKYSVFTTFFVSEFTKNYYHSTGIIDKINEKNSDDNWFFEFKNGANEYEVNLDYNQNIGSSLIMFINYKVYDYAKKFIGAIGVGIELLDIEYMLNSFKNKYKYDVYFTDDKGEILLFSKSLNKRGNISSIAGLNKHADQILSDKSQIIEYSDDQGNEYFLNTKYIEELHLHLLVEINKKEYMSELNQRFYLNLIASLLVTLLVVVIIIYVINIYQTKLENIAKEDALTELSNRRAFNESFEKLSRLYYRGNIKSITLILIDIDNFKSINDNHGHLVGDRVLKMIAKILKSSLRLSDTIARWGGEEFAILLVDVSDEEALSIAEKLRSAIKENHDFKHILSSEVTISLGVSRLQSTDSQDGLIQRVDAALYEAKKSGKNQVISL